MRRKSIFSKASIENSECSLDIISAVTAILTRYDNSWITAKKRDECGICRFLLVEYGSDSASACLLLFSRETAAAFQQPCLELRFGTEAGSDVYDGHGGTDHSRKNGD